MPRDFKSFVNENQNLINDNKEKADDLNDLLNKYKDMDNSDLMSNLFKEASKLKAEGKLDNQTLNNLSNSLSPFLNQDQQEMLKNLIDAIK